MLVNEAKLVHDIRQSLGKQIIDVDVIANTMNDLDMENEEQITFKQIESVLEDTKHPTAQIPDNPSPTI